MNNKYFDIKDTIYNITEKYSEAIELLVSLGFDNLKDEKMRRVFGKSITLEDALKLKKISIDNFATQLVDKIENNENNLNKLSSDNEIVKIAGVLPCPVRVPLTESFENWISSQNFDFKLEYELKAASMGIDWLVESLKEQSRDKLPDLFISAGFDLFFDKELFGKYKAENIFEDITDIEQYNEDFHNDYIELKDPNKQYSIIGVVPAVFLVNKEVLGKREIPRGWQDILKDEFENSVSLPIGDFDLFNAILLNIYKSYGDEGIKRLGRSLQKSMHPSEMVKSHMKKYEKPAITIMPYFFTWMAKEGSPMVAVWPEDGAIISPIFMLSKKDKREKLKSIVDFFASKDVGEILEHNGKFPSVNPEVNNMVTKDNKYMWLGWDYIKENDISNLIKKCEDIFNNSVKGDDKQ
ncbi:ABC transporter substrate-binding protein [Sedimentibacter sp. MB31-C6]|uniref:ABC transporter substrate-binding protein n=1 Tax=Sedimentibacter sp. MB31-C6 TaxID=3109366 RepID=UPI002DDDAA23|nr:ABC transporter substrate-binding protein [Sedimentibacter sp. MB36-C1]WSI03255.1 ABC transporter substrate-binding protein [Sedimentibacter sp. MB36-C1]